MTRQLIRDITQEDIETYARDGVVCLRNVFDGEWADVLCPLALESRQDRAKYGLLPNIATPRYMARTMPDFRRFIFESPMAEAAGKVLQSQTVRFFFDELFAKPPESTRPTIWHNDRAGWPVSGQMVPSIWIPLTPISKSTSLECVAGSHRHDRLYWLFSPNARKMVRPDDRPIAPDIESLRGSPGLDFLTWEMDPGDMLIVHPWTLHYSHGNPSKEWRIAMSVRIFGDDIRWDPRPDCLNIAGVSFDEMIPGEAPGGLLFPLLWSADGACDGDSQYPRGFSTAWNADAYDRLKELNNPKVGFEDRLAAEGGGSSVLLEDLVADVQRTV